MTSEVSLSESHRVGWVQGKQLSQVENLHTVVDGFAPDDCVVLECSDLSPSGPDGIVLGQASEIEHPSLAADLNEGSSVELANGNELSSIVRSPTPRGGTLTLSAAESSVREEVMQIDLEMSARAPYYVP